MKKPSMISVLLFLTGLLCIIALIFFNKSTLKQITTTEKEVDTMSEQLTAKRDEVKQAVDKYATAIDTVQSNIDRMKQNNRQPPRRKHRKKPKSQKSHPNHPFSTKPTPLPVQTQVPAFSPPSQKAMAI